MARARITPARARIEEQFVKTFATAGMRVVFLRDVEAAA
jgi:hypothetical protein